MDSAIKDFFAAEENDNARELLKEVLMPSVDYLFYNLGVSFLRWCKEQEISFQAWEDSYAQVLQGKDSGLKISHGPTQNSVATCGVLIMDKATPSTLFFLAQLQGQASLKEILLIGENQNGIKGLQNKLKREWGEVQVLASAKKSRVLRLSTQANPPELLPVQIQYQWRNSSLAITSHAGTFGFGKVDQGTQLLLNALPDLSGQRVLDIGCGNGILSKAAHFAGAQKVFATDISAQALQSTTENIPEATVFASLIASTFSEPVDTILTNPPFHVGKQQKTTIPEFWSQQCALLLPPKGQLILVANRFLPYQDFLHREFEKLKVLAENHEFVVYMAEK